ncbi:hypothetical protein [Streptosporangium sp. KLBMP 9127]|nr:hypothetical protein [Streptosporangium sp. KLBMP 9127]
MGYRLRAAIIFLAPLLGIALVTAVLAVPVILLYDADEKTLDRWSKSCAEHSAT